MALPPPSLSNVLTHWTFDPAVAAVLAVLALGYAAGLLAHHRAGRRWSPARTSTFAIAGLGSVAFCTMSGLASYAHLLLWPLAVQVTALLTVCPTLLALGDPLGLLRGSLPAGGRSRYDGIAHSRVVRGLTFPAVPAVLAVVLQLAVFFTGFAGAAAAHSGTRVALYLLCLAVGCLFALPMLGVELLPLWCTQPIRLLFAGADGLIDAIPGIAVVGGAGTIAGGYYSRVHLPWSTGVFTDREIAGGLMIMLAEIVAAPIIIALFVAWIREDERAAREIDVSLEAAAIVRHAEADLSGADAPGAAGQSAGSPPAADRPWWEIDPGPLRDRAARYGWDQR